MENGTLLSSAAARWNAIKDAEEGAEFKARAKATPKPAPVSMTADELSSFMNHQYKKLSHLVRNSYSVIERSSREFGSHKSFMPVLQIIGLK
jgi:hypothetical protein